jgi:hypothetical protein
MAKARLLQDTLELRVTIECPVAGKPWLEWRHVSVHCWYVLVRWRDGVTGRKRSKYLGTVTARDALPDCGEVVIV